MTVKIYLVRHGETTSNASKIFMGHLDMPLSAKGIEQGEELGRGLREHGVHFDAAFSSDLSRARITAESLLARQDSPPPLRIFEQLRERGKDWIPPVERKAEHGLESDASLRARLMSIFDNDILASGSSVLIVSHGAAISVLLNTLIARGFVSQDQVPTGRSVANCSVSVIEAVNKDQGAISSIGDEGYLQTRSDVVVGDA